MEWHLGSGMSGDWDTWGDLANLEDGDGGRVDQFGVRDP